MEALLILNLIMPFVMILVGYHLKKHPVLDMSTHNGYNTSVSRRSQEHWDYAQSIAPDIFLSLGKVLLAVETVLSIVLLLFRIPVYISVAAGMCIGVAFLVFGFYKTDSKIKGKFHNGSN